MQWKPSYVITLGLKDTDNINKISLNDYFRFINSQMGPLKSEHRKYQISKDVTPPNLSLSILIYPYKA